MPIQVTYPEPGLALVTVSNPSCRNALGVLEFTTLATAWGDIARERSVRCVIVTGEGELAFCSGAQMNEDFSVVTDINDLVDRALLKTCVYPLPLVAAINGHCVAGGFELMLACDVRVASSHARLGLPEVHWGIVPSGGGAMKLVEQIGYARAMRLLLSGELVSADEALKVGIVNEVVPASDLMARALSIARVIASNSPLAVAHTKQMALAGRSHAWTEREADERKRANLVRSSADALVGRQAFFDKKAPIY